jgi:hypothetical protein
MSGRHQRINCWAKLWLHAIMRFQLQCVNDELHIHQSARQQLYVQLPFCWLMRRHILAHRCNIVAQRVGIAWCMQNIADDLGDICSRAG